MTSPLYSETELQEIKDRNSCLEIAGRWVALRRQGKKWIGPCPIHSPNPAARDSTSFDCDVDSWRCAVCQNGGDVIKLVMLHEQIEFRAAVDWLGGARQVDQATEDERARQRQASKQKSDEQNNEFRERERGKLFDIWNRGVPITGTDVEHYLELRGLTAPPGVKLRCIAEMPYYYASGEIHRGPAMLAPLMRFGQFSGLHITWIDLNAPKGKLALCNPETGAHLPAKKVRGSKVCSHIELVSIEHPKRLIIGEGIEKVLAVWRAMHATDSLVADTAFWTSVDLGNLGGKAAPEPDLISPGIAVPDSVEEIVILGDGKPSGRFEVQCAAARAAKRWAKEGRSIKLAWAWDTADFDDVLRTEVPIEAACNRIADAIEQAQPVTVPVVAAPQVEPPTPRTRKKAAGATTDSTPASLAHAVKSDGAAEPPAANPLGFDVDALNREFALVLMGSKAVVFFEQQHAMLEDQKRMLAIDAFNAWFANRFTQIVGTDGKIKTVSWAKRWINDKHRRSYRGIEFHPNPDDAPGTKEYLNLWSGFAVEPARERDGRRYKTFSDHLLNNVCQGRADYFEWVFGFFAHIVQRPRERLGTALVMRGKMGTGKTKVGEIIGRLFPRHYFLVDDPRYVTGQFNAHMATCLLLQADEAVWAGDKAAEGRLKGLITAPIQQIEAKGIDPIRLPNYVRLIMTSNEEWVVPAGKDERRFAVLDVHPRCAQNHNYFREMEAELDNGGLAALLADLLAFDLSSVDLWRIPRTEALLEQKIRSLSSVDSWWFERLSMGATNRNGQHWRREVACSALFSDYLTTAEKIGIRRKSEQTVFGIAMGRLVPGLGRKKLTIEVEDDKGQTVMRRVPCYVLPSLDDARSAFEEHVEQTITWPFEDDDPPTTQAEIESRERMEF